MTDLDRALAEGVIADGIAFGLIGLGFGPTGRLGWIMLDIAPRAIQASLNHSLAFFSESIERYIKSHQRYPSPTDN